MEPSPPEDRPSPQPAPTPPPPKPESRALSTWGELLTFFAVVVALGAVIAAIIIGAHSVKNCSPNPYNASLTYCNGTSHPWVGTAFVVGVGGLLQAALIGVVGRIASEVQVISRAVRGIDPTID